MTEYTPGNSQEVNSLLADAHMVVPLYPSNEGASYIYSNDQVPYTPVNAVYPMPHFIPVNSQMADEYHQNSSHLTGSLTQPHTLAQTERPAPRSSTHRYPYTTRAAIQQDYFSMVDTEEQDSDNRESTLSEPVSPVLAGYPDVKEFDVLMRSYVHELSPRKQDKALIHAKRAANIKIVLIDKKTTAVESAQFRFWARKMFQLLPNDPKIPNSRKKICHEGKPVAIREKLFKILTIAHKQCQHGGRDKTSIQVRRIYSWVPKELISRFVQLCPTCRIRRGPPRTPPTVSDNCFVSEYIDMQSPPEISSQPDSRKSSTISRQRSLSSESSFQQTTYSSTFQPQIKWLSSTPQTQPYTGSANVLIPTPSHTPDSNVGPPANYSTGNLHMVDGHDTVIGTYLGN